LNAYTGVIDHYPDAVCVVRVGANLYLAAMVGEFDRGVRRLPLKEAKILSEEHKAVLLVVIGYRQKERVSKSRVGRYSGWRPL
jgi:hypothetical protein